jgi:hypothetical protein
MRDTGRSSPDRSAACGNACIPAQAAIVDKSRCEHGGHRLGYGTDHEPGVGRDRLSAAEFLDTEAAEIADLAALNDGNRGTGHAELRDGRGHVALEGGAVIAD